MSTRITVDPITRIEGHLRIDVEVNGGKVTNSWSSGQMFRGIETILQGRDPRDAWIFTQRLCGVCTTVHAIASVRAVENALGIEIPINAQYIRNVIVSAHALHDHMVHFYHLSALDWVDVTSALKADPAKAAALGESLSPWPHNSKREMEAVKEKLASFVAGGQLGIFTNGYWGHPAMKLPPEVNLLAVAHYLQALEYQFKANKVVAILGSKTPNIQNLAVGGVANAINLNNQATLNMEKLFMMKDLLEEVAAFVQQVYLPDVAAIGAMYPEWLGYGGGVTNYLSVPDLPLDTEVDGEKKYSWVKAPRFEGRPMQVGPLAQVLVGYATGHPIIKKYADQVLSTASAITKVKLGPNVLHSTLGRHAARAVRAATLSELALKHLQLLTENIGKGDVAIFTPWTYPAGEQRGFGFHEAPRGALSHWVVIRDGKIVNYQAVVPSTWNAGPRDEKGQKGPYEASLVGNPIADTAKPLEVLRTVHSFDPCLACAIHTLDVEGHELSKIRTLT